MFEHRVIAVRATGLMPDAVAEEVEQQLNKAGGDRWELHMIQPVIYNSSTTGYFLLIFRRPREG